MHKFNTHEFVQSGTTLFETAAMALSKENLADVAHRAAAWGVAVQHAVQEAVLPALDTDTDTESLLSAQDIANISDRL